MYCIKCGADNLEAAKFCRKCGEEVAGATGEPEIETRVAARVSKESGTKVEELAPDKESVGMGGEVGDRVEIFSITPTLMFVKAGYALAALCALFLVAIFSVFKIVPVWVAIFMGLLLLLVPAYFHVKQKLVRYTLTDTSLEIDSGFISRTTRNVPIRRIQDVTVSSNVFQRLLGFGDLVIDNASEEGGKAVLRNINTPKQYADDLLKQMRLLDK